MPMRSYLTFVGGGAALCIGLLLLGCGAAVPTQKKRLSEEEGQAVGRCAAEALRNYLTQISGKHILSGQESMFSDGNGFPSVRDAHVHKETKKYPVVYSSDFGDVRQDNLYQRQNVVYNALAYAERGSIIQLHNHMVQPDRPDGAGFETMHGFKGDYPYMDDILQAGSELNVEHMRRLDELADYLQQLRDEGVAVLWRPYHEMNGEWFWWGQQPRYKELWIQQWQYFTHQRHLTNLVWVWSVNYFEEDAAIDVYYPGHSYVDVLGVDVYLKYGHHFDSHLHDKLRELGKGKPIAITENGEMPHVPTLRESQPFWVYWTTWWGHEGENENNSTRLYGDNYGDAHVRTQGEVTLSRCE